MVRIIDVAELDTVSYIPGEPFTVDIDVIAEDGETPYVETDDYTISIDWREQDDETYTKTTTPAVAVTALTGDDSGVRIILVIPSSVTDDWPLFSQTGVCRVQHGIGTTATSIAAGKIKPSKFARHT